MLPLETHYIVFRNCLIFMANCQFFKTLDVLSFIWPHLVASLSACFCVFENVNFTIFVCIILKPLFKMSDKVKDYGSFLFYCL